MAVRLWLMSAAASSLLALLAALVAGGHTREADLATTIAFQSLASPALDIVVNWHTLLGQAVTTTLVAAVLSLVLWRRGHRASAAAPLLLFLTAAIELVLKFSLAHAGPPDEYVRAFMNPLGVRVATPSAFPSGQAARIAFLAFVTAAMFPARWVRAALVAYVVLSLFFRVYIGDHWVSDVLGGAAIGAAVGAPAALWIRGGGAQSAASKSSFARRK